MGEMHATERFGDERMSRGRSGKSPTVGGRKDAKSKRNNNTKFSKGEKGQENSRNMTCRRGEVGTEYSARDGERKTRGDRRKIISRQRWGSRCLLRTLKKRRKGKLNRDLGNFVVRGNGEKKRIQEVRGEKMEPFSTARKGVQSKRMGSRLRDQCGGEVSRMTLIRMKANRQL